MIQPNELKLMLIKDADNNKKAMDRINGNVNECKSIVHRERCEFASKLKDCLVKSATLQRFTQFNKL